MPATRQVRVPATFRDRHRLRAVLAYGWAMRRPGVAWGVHLVHRIAAKAAPKHEVNSLEKEYDHILDKGLKVVAVAGVIVGVFSWDWQLGLEALFYGAMGVTFMVSPIGACWNWVFGRQKQFLDRHCLRD